MRTCLKIISILFLTTFCFAEPVVVSSFPFRINNLEDTYKFTKDGWVFSSEQELTMRIKLLESQYLEQQNNIYKQNETLLKEKLQLQEQVSDKYRTAMLKSEEYLVKVLAQRSRHKFWYFVLGVGVTLAAGATMGFIAGGL